MYVCELLLNKTTTKNLKYRLTQLLYYINIFDK
jgi:hypothetical protein